MTGKMSEREARDKLIETLEPIVAMLPALANLLRQHAFEETAARLDQMKQECDAAVASVRENMPP